MQVQDERSQSYEERIEALEREVNRLTTENMLLQEQLKRREQFTAMIAHELRGPLTPIRSYAEQIKMRPNQSKEKTQRGISIILSQAQRLSRLVSDLLDASRLSSDQFTLKRELCDVVALAQEVAEQIRPVAPYHTIAINAPDGSLMGNWDGERLQQAIGNLLDNAVKYSDMHSTITVRLWRMAKDVYVSVHNEGASIPSAESSHLFKPFVRLQGANGPQGSGLGLYITKCIVEAHGGALRIESPAPEGRGTTFTLNLPLE